MSSDQTSTDGATPGVGEADELTRALLPTVEKAIRISVKRDSRPLVDAIFPIMGPAIRKSIAEALRTMVQSLSRSLENSFSIRGLAWRLEAWRTGRPFAEVVLLHSLVYRVEQVPLIHRETGLLLQQVHPAGAEPQEGDMVSAMLTAIRDFVRDSFSPDGGGALETIRMGDVNVWVEDGPQAILAAVVRGTAPEGMRAVFSGAQEAVHSGFHDQLAAFSGDTTHFEAARGILEGCLGEQQRATKQRVNPLVFVLPALLMIGAGVLLWRFVSLDRDWDELVRDIERRPGVIVLESDRNGKGGFIRGVRDPASGTFDDLIMRRGWDLSRLRQEWTLIEVAWPPYDLYRISRALSPPADVDVTLSDEWVLAISGRAGHAWIDRAAITVRAFPRISRVDMTGLQDVDAAAVDTLAGSVREKVHLFDVGSALPAPEETATILETASQMVELVRAARRAHMNVEIVVSGRADPTGPDAKNRVLSLDRAASVVAILVAAGVPADSISARGLGTEPVTDTRVGHNRCVTYGVTLESYCND